eukprot:jgi/Tetstr1/426916/TSEL_017129.t1
MSSIAVRISGRSRGERSGAGLAGGGPVGSMAEAWSGRAASSGLAFLLVTLLAISTGIVRQGNAQPIFDRLTQRETTCQYSLFVWEELPSNATQRDRITVNSEMIRFCREFDPNAPGAAFPGLGFNCRLVFLGTSSLPSVQVTLEGCCEGTVAKDMIFDFPAVEYCRDQVIGEDPNNIRVDIVGVTDQPTPAPTAPTPSSAPTPVPTVTVDPAGNGTIIYKSEVANVGMGLSDWRFWVPLLLLLLLMLLLLLCCLCYLCHALRHDERNNAYAVAQRPVGPKPWRLPLGPPLDNTEDPNNNNNIEPPVDLPVPKPPSLVSSHAPAYNSIYAPSEARPTSFSTFGVTEPAGHGPRAAADLDARSDSTFGGPGRYGGSPLDDMTLPEHRRQREGLGDDSSSDASTIYRKLPSGRRLMTPYE